MRRLYVLLLVTPLIVACDGNLTAPNTPAVPSVAGSYSGTVRTSDVGVICATTTSVTQSGSSVTIAPLQVGECINTPTNSPLSLGFSNIPIGESSIDEAGALKTVTGALPNPPCSYRYETSSPRFDPNLRMVLNMYSVDEETCYNLKLTVNLTRQ